MGSPASDTNLTQLSVMVSPPCGDVEEEEEEDCPFYFESDHLALKANNDYHALLRTVCLLEVQRVKASHDLEQLYHRCDQALQDPIGFVQKLQNKEDLGLPSAQRVAVIPDIAWDNYTASVNLTDLGLHKHSTRGKNKEGEIGNHPMKKKWEQLAPVGQDAVIVRGRVKDASKPSTFNKLWTADEQRRLEELLIEYPPERVEAHRFAKIAKALGNRTPQQVASRIQKYFLKLAKAKLPIPGRVPKLGDHFKKMGTSRYQKFYHPASTFLQSYEPPVYMPDDEQSDEAEDEVDDGRSEENFVAFSAASSVCSEDGPQSTLSDREEQVSYPESVRKSEDYLELLRLKKLKQEKLRGLTYHHGFKCDVCDMDPIIGTRWHCLQCPEESCVDFCDTCVGRSFETESHKSSHRLEQITEGAPAPVMDSDYMRFMPGGYNYLDPNYMPAS